jgi:hypothetical protein
MIVFRPLMAVAVLALASTAAFAFQEQQAGAPIPSAGKAGAAAQLDVPSVVVPESVSKGTPVRIPGLGTLGVIPKMDFGLELLYGVADASSPVKRPDPKNSDGDDVLIRGAIKHKF